MKKYVTEYDSVEITFFEKKVEDKHASLDGKTVTRIEDWFTYRNPNTTDSVERRVYPDDIRRYPHAWDSYQMMKTETPLTAIVEDQEVIRFLEENGVQSVEYLAAMPTDFVKDIAESAMAIQKKAREYVKKNKDKVSHVPAENKEIEKLNEMIKILMEALPEGKRKIVEEKIEEVEASK